MGSESIAHSAFGLMGYWLRAHEGEKNNCFFSKIQLVGKKYILWADAAFWSSPDQNTKSRLFYQTLKLERG